MMNMKDFWSALLKGTAVVVAYPFLLGFLGGLPGLNIELFPIGSTVLTTGLALSAGLAVMIVDLVMKQLNM